jgi:monovalent cation:H+ antiporter-2, CPA2 family
MEDLPLARDLLVILTSAFFGGLIAKKLKFPVIIGYLISGIIVGSFFSSQTNFSNNIRNIAEIGVAFLMFTLGLEFSLDKIRKLGFVIIFCSLIQIILTVIISSFVFPLFGFNFFTSLFLGAVFSLSSTAVVVKSLLDRGELDTLHGEIAAGWLFMQDLYTLPIMIILPGIGILIEHGKFDIVSTLYFVKSIGMAVISFVFILTLGRKIMPKAIEKIVAVKSRELLLVATVAVCLFFAFIFKTVGFSFAVGAFIAGILIASTSVKHGIFSEVRPLRDIFSVVFFVSLGMMIDVSFLFHSLVTVFLISVFIMSIKFIISSALVILTGYHTRTASLVGLSLTSIGEFAFIIALTGMNNHLIDQNTYMMILYVSFVSLIFSIPIFSGANRIYSGFKHILTKRFKYILKLFEKIDRANLIQSEIKGNHIVVLGYGRVGKYICRALDMEKIPYLVVDYDHIIVKKLKSSGINVIYGDPSEIDVLKFAKADTAKLIIIAYFDRATQKVLVTNIFSLNKNARIICRLHFEEDQQDLKALGVSMIIQPEFEAAVSITEKLLRELNLPEKDIQGKILRLKIEHGMG